MSLKKLVAFQTHLLGFLLELLDGTLVDTTALVDQVSGGGGLARVDVADDDNVNMDLLLAHCWLMRLLERKQE